MQNPYDGFGNAYQAMPLGIPGQFGSVPYGAFAGGMQPVSVRGDATYLIPGPVCSGSGFAPTGYNCPRAGSQAVSNCRPGIPSFTGMGVCAAPLDAVCVKVFGDTWGCALMNDYIVQNPAARPWGQSINPYTNPLALYQQSPLQSRWFT